MKSYLTIFSLSLSEKFHKQSMSHYHQTNVTFKGINLRGWPHESGLIPASLVCFRPQYSTSTC